MTTLVWNMSIRNCAVTLEFNWYGEEPDWEGMTVMGLLPSAVAPEAKHWVKINDLLTDDDWSDITAEIYWNENEFKRQALEQEY